MSAKSFLTLFLFVFLALPHTLGNAPDQKTRIAVGQLKWEVPLSDSQQIAPRQQTEVINAVRTMVILALQQSGKFDVYDRQDLDQILNEIDFSQSVLTEKDKKTPLWGKLKGVTYLCLGSVVQYSIQTRGKKFAGVGKEQTSLLFSLYLRIVEVKSSKILFAGMLDNEIALASRMKFKLDPRFLGQVSDLFNASGSLAETLDDVGRVGSYSGLYNSGENKGMAGQVGKLLRQTANRIVLTVASLSDPLKILQNGRGELVLNYGRPLLQPGDQLEVFEVQKNVGPRSELKGYRYQIGRIEVVAVQPNFAVARPLDGRPMDHFNPGLVCEMVPIPLDEQFEKMKKKRKKKKKKY